MTDQETARQEQLEDPAGVSLALVAVDDHVGGVA